MPMQRRLPKIGFRSKRALDVAEVLLYQLDKLDAGTIDFAALKAAKLVPNSAKQAKIVKKGEVSKKFVLKGLLATAGAKAAIEAAGGQLEAVDGVSDAWREAATLATWVAGSASSPSCASACCSWSGR